MLPSWLATLLSVLFGGAFTMLAGWFGDQRMSKRDQERRRAEHAERVAIRRSDFQRATLLALQVLVQKLLRVTGQINHFENIEFRRTGKWKQPLLPEAMSDDHFNYMTEVNLLSSRVCDDEVRALSGKLREKVVEVIMLAPSPDQATSDMMLVAEIQGALITRIGLLLREIDNQEQGAV